MQIRTIFELESIKDQLALIESATSHIDLDGFGEKELDADYKRLLLKLDNSAKNLKEKFEKIKHILDN